MGMNGYGRDINRNVWGYGKDINGNGWGYGRDINGNGWVREGCKWEWMGMVGT